ncbi:MAG: response regulator [Halobacteriales archaeon]|nr:response regulator [Halobacteriales archaeon]
MKQKRDEVDTQTKSPNILVAEDDDGIRELVESKLDMELGRDYEIATAEDGEETWTYLTEHAEDPPKLIVLDVMMPGLDGFSVLEKIRRDDRFEDMKVIILTSRSREEDISQALESGADDFVAKPFSPNDLVKSVEELL